MKRSYAHVRAHESTARRWLEQHQPGDDHGPIGPVSDTDLFGPDVVLDAFEAGHDHADQEWAIERAVGQRQLDEASALIMEACALFMGYADHHKRRADEAEKRGDVELCAASLRKAHVNLSMAVSMREWLQGEDPVSGEDTAVAHGQVIELRRSRPGWWDKVLDFAGVTSREQAERIGQERFANRAGYGERSNVRPVTSGALSDPVVVEGLMAAAGMADATDPISMATATAFRLQTPDPRFDPTRPVCVNGFLYRPATEA